jgi:ABC-2 type transport system ATP-binding protein
MSFYINGKISFNPFSILSKTRSFLWQNFYTFTTSFSYKSTSILNITTPNKSLSNMGNQILQAKNLIKSYNETEVLKGIDLEIEKGQIIGYIGPNGAGKSTTIKIFCGLLTNFQGDVSVLGFDIRKNPLEVKQRIGYIPENASLYDMLTPMEFIEFIGDMRGLPADETREKAESILKLFEIHKNMHDRIATFSKGMRQKVLIGSALLHNPQLIFMDEPLTGLDANSVIMIKEMLVHLAREGKTIFYSSHIMDVVERISNRIVLLDQGKVVADGSFDELKSLSNDLSLENLFTRLTGNSNYSEKAEELFSMLNK